MDQEGLEIKKEIVLYMVRQVITLGSAQIKIKIKIITRIKTETKIMLFSRFHDLLQSYFLSHNFSLSLLRSIFEIFK